MDTSIAKKKKNLWFGMLEAGPKSTLVVRDASLGTGDPSVIYIFNMNRGAILEYRTSIAESRLRELTPEEMNLTASMEEAFDRARAGFVPRRIVQARMKPRPRPVVEMVEVPDEPELDNDVPLLPLFDDEPGNGTDTADA